MQLAQAEFALERIAEDVVLAEIEARSL